MSESSNQNINDYFRIIDIFSQKDPSFITRVLEKIEAVHKPKPDESCEDKIRTFFEFVLFESYHLSDSFF